MAGNTVPCGSVMRSKTGQGWDAGYRHGRFAFLRRPEELARLDEIAALIAALIARHGPCEIVDIGCGEGLLVPRLKSLSVTRYIGLDVSGVALSRVPSATFPVTRVCQPLAQWDGSPGGNSPRILVASEVLYYGADGVAQLQRLAQAIPATVAVIVSCVAGRRDKPNWDAASRRLWSEMTAPGWPVSARRVVQEGELAWDIAAYDISQ